MSQRKWLALLLAASLFAAALSAHSVRAEPDEDEDFDGEDLPEAEEESSGDIDEKDVVVLTEKNFNDVVKKAKYALVEFYAPWCGHCKSLAPEYAKAATALKAVDPTIVLGKVDATAESGLGQEYGVQGYPTLKWFVDGEASDYGGGRVEDEIVKWVKKKTGPPAATLETTEAAEKVKADVQVFVLGYFINFEGADFEAFNSVATALEDVEFYQTSSAEVAKLLGTTAPGIAVGKSFDGFESVPFSGNVEKEALTTFINGEKLPAYLEFHPDNQNKIFGSGIQLNIIVVGDSKALAKDGDIVKAIKAAHQAVKGKVVFVTSDTDGENSATITDYFGLDAKPEQAVGVGFNLEAGKKYKMQGTITEASLKQFAEDLVAGKLTPDFKSEDLPAEPKDGDVMVVVGKNFDEIVMDPTKDVLLEAYAPWCGHCKELVPTWKKLGKRFRKVDSIVIAKVDATANEHAALNVQGFPTILLFPAGENKEPITFEGGDRSLKAFTQFLKENAKIPFELPKKAKGDEKVADSGTTEAAGDLKEELEEKDFTSKDEL